jgi:phosphatidylserine decarboxylase
MNVFDVHVNRSPVDGRITRIAYVPGKFMNAELDKSSVDNERQAFTVEMEGGGRIGLVQIAGLLARRIVKFVGEGEEVQAGQRIGLIRFGSRVDIYLPDGQMPFVAVGQRSIAGETVLADLRANEGARECRRS